MSIKGENDEIWNDNSVNNEINFLQESEIITTINNDVSCTTKNNEFEHISITTEENQLQKDVKNDENLELRESCSNSNEENIEKCTVKVDEENVKDIVNQSEINEQSVASDDNNNSIINSTDNIVIQSNAEQVSEVVNVGEPENTEEVKENNGVLPELVFILRVQRCLEAQEAHQEGSRNISRSRSPVNRVRPNTRRARRQRAAAPLGSLLEESVEGEREVENVDFETITTETVPCKMTRTWRTVPKYKRLTLSETLKQEADLFYSFLKETNPETVNPAGLNDHYCRSCIKNKATRIIMPCGHLCLCYDCAKTIAFTRTTLASELQPKRCLLCQAAISKMLRLL